VTIAVDAEDFDEDPIEFRIVCTTTSRLPVISPVIEIDLSSSPGMIEQLLETSVAPAATAAVQLHHWNVLVGASKPLNLASLAVRVSPS
jgi:hypothetical protein